MFATRGYKLVSEEEAEAIVFCGGGDIHPSIYGEACLPVTRPDVERDRNELAVYSRNSGKPMIGICRGAQLLNCLAGGRLWQDVDMHAGAPHEINIFSLTGESKGTQLCNSVHHQQMRPTSEAVILAVAHRSTRKLAFGQMLKSNDEPYEDVEIVWYPKPRFFCFQGHPEFRHYATEELFFNQLREVYG